MFPDDMHFELEQLDGESITVVHVHGILDRFSCPQLKERLARAVESGGTEIIVDLTGVDSVDSSGLGVLVGTLKLARRAGGDLRLTGANHRLATTIERLSLDQLLRQHASVQDAVASFRATPNSSN